MRDSKYRGPYSSTVDRGHYLIWPTAQSSAYHRVWAMVRLLYIMWDFRIKTETGQSPAESEE